MAKGVNHDAARAAQFANLEGVSLSSLTGIPEIKTYSGAIFLNNTTHDHHQIARKIVHEPVEAEQNRWYSHYWRLLNTNSVFRILCAQYSISISGDALNMMAMLYMLQRETSSSLALSGLLATRQLPYIIFAPVAGWLSDRFQRLHVMAVCDALRMFVVLLYLINSRGGSLWLLFALGFLQHSLSTLSDPAFHAMIPQYVPPESLPSAHTIITTLWAIVVSIAYGIGGALVAVAGPVPNIIGDSLCYAMSLALIVYLMVYTSTLPRFIAPKPNPEAEYVTEEEATTRSTSSEADDGVLEEVTVEDGEDDDEAVVEVEAEEVRSPEEALEVDETFEKETSSNQVKSAKQGIGASLVEAVKYLVVQHYIIALSVLRLLDALGYGAVSLIAIKLAEEELHIVKSAPITLGVILGAQDQSFLTTALVLGPFLGHFIVGLSLERTHSFLVLCTILETSAMALIAWSPHVSILIIAASLHMAAMSSNHVTATSLIQRIVPSQLYARVNALDTSASAVLELIALFVTGALMDDLHWGSRTVMLAFALVATGATLVIHVLFTMTFSPHRVFRTYGSSLLLKVDGADS